MLFTEKKCPLYQRYDRKWLHANQSNGCPERWFLNGTVFYSDCQRLLVMSILLFRKKSIMVQMSFVSYLSPGNTTIGTKDKYRWKNSSPSGYKKHWQRQSSRKPIINFSMRCLFSFFRGHFLVDFDVLDLYRNNTKNFFLRKERSWFQPVLLPDW